MKTMKYFCFLAAFACLFAACSNYDDPVVPEPEQNGPTAKEKAMVKEQMTWRLDSVEVIKNYQQTDETRYMLYAGIDTDQWSYTFYPSDYKFPDDIVFDSYWSDDAIQISERFNEDYCKYICTYEGEIISAGYLTYYRDMFTFDGLKQGEMVEFMIRETDTNWDTEVWTVACNTDVEQDGTVNERTIEYYSRVDNDDLDGGDGRGGTSITVNGTTFTVSNARWRADVLNGNDTFYTIQIANSDVFAGADPFDVVSIVYKVANGNTAELATGEFADFEVSLTRVSSNDSQDRQYYTSFTENPGAKLKVTKIGGGYNVQFGAMKYTVDGSANAQTYNGTAFSFTGAVAKGLLLQ